MFLMYIVADAVWIWMEPEALPSLQPVILGAHTTPSSLVAASRLCSSFQRHELAGVNNPGSTTVHTCCKGGNGVVAKSPQTLFSIDLQTYRTLVSQGTTW